MCYTGEIMDPLGKKELIEFYNRHLKHFGDRPEAVRWTPEGQRRRYETLLELAGDISGKTVLDFGCGKGDLCGFLKEKGVSTDYCGIDINEALLSMAKSKYPEDEFIALDIDEAAFNRIFDIVFVCGVFNLRIAGIEESMKTLLKNLFSRCGGALHINLLTYYVPQRNVELFYVKPEEILEFVIKEISTSVTLRHFEEDIFLSIYR
jgi:SAM-dependent methyltransferase